jgi:hypothetical protein
MTVSRPPLRAALALGAVLTLLATAGCAATDASAGDASATPAASTAPVAEVAAGTDEESCAGFGDIMTIMHNVGAAVHDGRMTEQEKAGWYGLATRVLDRVPASGEGPISDALTALQESAPAVEPGGSSTGIESDAWNAAGTELREACEAEGYDASAVGFIGG